MSSADGRVHPGIRLYRRRLLGGATWAAAGPDEPPPRALRDRVGASVESDVPWLIRPSSTCLSFSANGASASDPTGSAPGLISPLNGKRSECGELKSSW